jgi:hypothetical protein
MLQILRERIPLIPAQLVRSENRPQLLLPRSGPSKAAWRTALQKIERLKPSKRHFSRRIQVNICYIDGNSPYQHSSNADEVSY